MPQLPQSVLDAFVSHAPEGCELLAIKRYHEHVDTVIKHLLSDYGLSKDTYKTMGYMILVNNKEENGRNIVEVNLVKKLNCYTINHEVVCNSDIITQDKPI